MEKELTSAEKSRKTKLSKKSSEELINIIIRKDDIERRKDKLIGCLKSNIIGLENKVANIKKDIETTENECTNMFKKYNQSTNLANKYKTELNTLKTNVELYEYKIDTLHRQLRKALNVDVKCFILGMVISSIIWATIKYVF